MSSSSGLYRAELSAVAEIAALPHNYAMLAEIKNARQIPGEGYRRWFTDADMDLIIWYQDDSLAQISGFQLSYDKLKQEQAFTWTKQNGFQLNRIDNGEVQFGAKMSPVLVPASGLDAARVLALFQAKSIDLESGLIDLVQGRIQEYAASHFEQK